MTAALRLRYVLPLVVFAAMAVALGVGLTLKPREIPSVLIDKPVPRFALPGLQGMGEGFSSEDLVGKVRLVNFFASWCIACRAEHPLLNRLNSEGIVPVFGINYKDKPTNARAFLDRLGNPYSRIGTDRDGRVGIDWGVYGLPESFLVDRNGRIIYKQIGPFTERDIERTLIPLIEKLKR